MKKLSNQQLIEKVFQRINSEPELTVSSSSAELSVIARRLIVDARDTIDNFNLPIHADLPHVAK
jgi:hypothetical protein